MKVEAREPKTIGTRHGCRNSVPFTTIHHPTMPPISNNPPKIDSLLPPILANLSSTPPNPYSAHQKALTTTARLAAAKHHDIAIEICITVSRELLKLGEAGSGVELAVRGLGYMVDSEVDVDDKTRGMFKAKKGADGSFGHSVIGFDTG